MNLKKPIANPKETQNHYKKNENQTNEKTKSNPNLVFWHVHREPSPILHHFREKNLLTQILTFFMVGILLFNHFLSPKNFSVITTRKLVNTNRNTNRFFRWYFAVIFTDQIFLPSPTSSVNTNENMSSVYIEGIAIGIKGIKKSKQCNDM